MTSPAVQAKVEKLLAPFHPIHAKKMFGGIGIYSAESGNIFAMISRKNILYFKTDDTNRSDYEAAGMEQFIHMPYFKVPESVLSDDEQLREWLAKSTAIAARAKKKKPRKKKSAPQSSRK